MNRRNKEILSILVSVVFIFIAILQDKCGIFDSFPYDWFLVKIDNKDDLFTNLFTVQATIAGLSLAIIAFISGMTDKTVYGVSVSEYISRIRPWKLKHKTLLIIDLIITILDYFAVSLKLFNLSVIIFIISIFISILLILDVFFVFYGNDEIKNRIGNYIISSYDKKYIDNISEKITKTIKQKDVEKINDYFDILVEIFKHELHNDKRKEIIESIESLYAQTFTDAVKIEDNKLSIYILNNIIDIYDYSSEENIVPLRIWDNINNSYFKLLKNLSYFELQENKHHIITKFRKLLYQNQTLKKSADGLKLYNHFNLNYFSYYVYINTVYSQEQKFSNDEKNYLSEYIFELSFYNLTYQKNKTEEYIMDIIFEEFINLLKLFIEDGKANILENCFFSKMHYNYRNNYLNLAFIVAYIYMYYLGYRENIVKGEPEQKNAIELIKFFSRRKKFYSNMKLNDIFKERRHFILDKINNWEKYRRNKIKTLVMEDVVYDFIIFSMLSIYNIQFTMDVVKSFNYQELLALIDRYIKSKDEMFQLYLQFPKSDNSNNESETESTKKFNDFISELKKYIKQYEQEQVYLSNQIITKKISAAFKNNIENTFKNAVNNLLKELPFQQPKITENNSNYKIIFSLTVPVSTLNENFKDSENEYSEIFKQFLLDQIEYRIKESIIVHKISCEKSDNHKLLLKLKKDYGIYADTFYGDKAVLWDLEMSDEKEYFDNFKYAYFPGTLAALLDSNKVQINIYDIEVQYRDLSLDDIVCNELADNTYEYTNSYGVTLKYSKEDLINYINMLRRKVFISARLEYSIQKNSGVAIEVDL